jgi:hypothetical protein
MKTVIIVTAVAGMMFATADACAAWKRLAVHKAERLHEHCSCSSKGAAPTLSFATSGVEANAAESYANGEGKLPGADASKSLCWLFAVTIIGVFLVKKPFGDASTVLTHRCVGARNHPGDQG